MQRFDVAVVGGGAMGTVSAYALARRGNSVALVEQFGAGHDRGSSHGRSRIFRLAYRQPHFTALAQRALPGWRALEDDAGETLLTTTGGVDHGDPTMLHDIRASLEAAGVVHSVLSAADASARWPMFRFDGDVLHQPDAGRVDADAAVRALQRRCVDLGVAVRCDEQVIGIVDVGRGVEVVTSAGTLHADVVVIAAGAWLPKLASSLQLALPTLTVTQEQPAYFPVSDGEEWPVFVHYADVPHYGLFTPGSGMKVGEHGSGIVVDPDARVDVDMVAAARLTSYVDDWLPGVEPAAVRVDSCLYTTTPDEEFVLKRIGRIVVCSACSGHGFKFAPVIGEQVAALAIGE